MKRSDFLPIDMPRKGIVRKRGSKDTVYIYYTLRAYRNEKGRPTSETALIGKLAPDGISLIPNMRYYEIFDDEVPDGKVKTIDSVRSAGLTGTFSLLAQRIGLVDSLAQAFPEKYKAILTSAMYMAECGNVMAYIDDWLDVTDAPCGSLDSKRTPELFAEITADKRTLFFKGWTGRHREDGHIAYNVTSISTHSDTIEQAEWGHNRDGESLAQLNIGMFYGVESKLPLYYSLYNGSICDKSHLSHMMGGATSFDIEDVSFVIDKGFVTADNLDCLDDAGLRFLAPCPPSRKDARALVERIGKQVKDPANWMRDEGCYGMCREFTLLGRDLIAHVFFDSARFANQEQALYAYIERLERELDQIVSAKIKKKYRDFFSFDNEEAKEKKTTFTRNEKAIAKALESAGFAAFITNDDTLSPQDALNLYRKRDDVEKAFDDLKNEIDFKRIKTHSQKTTEGKAFVGFIALILRSHMLDLLKKDKATRTMTPKKAMLELSKLRYIVREDDEQEFLPVTKTQITIANALGMSLV